MKVNYNQLETEIIYPDGDGAPMAESDATRDYLIYGVEALGNYFKNRNDVYVSGNLFVYYKKNIPSAVIAPDVFVIFGVENKKRITYKAWEENNKVPNFVLEVTSKTTQENDEYDKVIKYAQIGVQEYFQYDPTGDYLKPQLKGRTLIEGRYQLLPATMLADGVLSIHSDVLGLDLRLYDGELRFYDPQTQRKLLSPQEIEQARQEAQLARQEAELARQAALQAKREAIPRLKEMGLTLEQIAAALNLSVEEVRKYF